MTLCPVAIVAGCRKCPAVAVCPLKGVLGDYKPDEIPPQQQADAATRGEPRAK